MNRDSLGDRMKDYESITRAVLPRKSWVVLRIDGRNFHAWTRGLERPFSMALARAIDSTAAALCEEISGAVLAYTQSDEISVLMHDFTKPGTEPWFGGIVQKIASVSASIATAYFNQFSPKSQLAHFDARVFTVPSASEAANYLIWRQRDAVRNSISMAAHAMFSQKQLHGVSSNQMQEMLFVQGVNWNDYPIRFKRGGQVVKRSGPREVTFIDKHEGCIQTVTAERSWWETQPADHFVHDALVSRLDTMGVPA
jgi:tRNA(His) guanylyltransferase